MWYSAAGLQERRACGRYYRDSVLSASVPLETAACFLIMTDIILPGASWLELLAQWKERHSTQNVAIMTAFGSRERTINAIHRLRMATR